MLVRDLMTTDLVTIPAEASLRDAIRRMLSAEVGYVIVVDNDGNPGGIITENDVLHAVYQADPPPEEIGVVAVAHSPDFTVDPSITVRKVARQMTSRNATRALVMEGLDPVGLLTLADIVEHLSVILQEVAVSEETNAQQDW